MTPSASDNIHTGLGLPEKTSSSTSTQADKRLPPSAFAYASSVGIDDAGDGLQNDRISAGRIHAERIAFISICDVAIPNNLYHGSTLSCLLALRPE
jgi:hypothetical protein